MKLAGALAVLSLLAGSSANPMKKVVSLLKGLETDLLKDEKTEQSVYDKYACWCEVTTARKAKAIESGKVEMQRLGQDILKLKGTVAVRTDEASDLSTQIKDNKEAQESATAVRKKENAAWQSESAETTSAQQAIYTAMGVLTKATKPALLQQDLTAKVQASVSAAVAAMPTRALSGLSPANLAKLRVVASLSQVNYAPQSMTIQGILGDMYTTMAVDLQDQTAVEANRNRAFEDFMSAKEAELSKMNKILLKTQGAKAEAAAQLAETAEAYDDVTNQLKGDVDFFDATKTACTSKTNDWKVRSSLRKAEVQGVEAALKILTSKEARKLFAKSVKSGNGASFLELDTSVAPKQKLDLEKVYATLKTRASSSHSLRLAALAAQVRLAKVGHFDSVIKSIDVLLNVLGQEQDADSKKLDQCRKQYQNIAKESAKIQWKIKKNNAEIQKLKSLAQQRSGDRQQTMKEIAVTQKAIKDMKRERKEEHAVFLQTKKDDLASIKLMQQAKAALVAFYKKNGVKMGKIQGSVKLLQEEEEANPDKAPQASFSNKGKRKMQSKGIVSIMTMLTQDLKAEVANEVKAEANAQRSFTTALASAEKLLEKLGATRVSLSGAIAKRNKDKAVEQKDKKENKADLADQVKEHKSIETDCDYMMEKYTERRKYREAEAEALNDAKEFLANYYPAKALLQSSQESPENESSRQLFTHLRSPLLRK